MREFLLNVLLFFGVFAVVYVPVFMLAFKAFRYFQVSHDRLHGNFLSLVNEMSIRTGGRKVFKDKKAISPNETIEQGQQPGEFRLITPSMAEVEAMDRDDAEGESNLSESDIEHLKREGLIS